MIARLEGRPVEVLGERTESSSVFALPDGTMAAGFAVGPVWVRRGGDGTQAADWVPLDLDLSIDGDGQVRAGAHPGDLVLSGGTPDGAPADEMVTVASVTAADGTVSSLQWQGPLPEPTLQGGRATYADVLPGVDMVVDATASGFEQYFVVREAPTDPASLRLPVSLRSDGATPQVAADGGVDLTRADGTVAARSPQPLMWDAASDRERVHPVTQPWQDLAAESGLSTTATWRATAAGKTSPNGDAGGRSNDAPAPGRAAEAPTAPGREVAVDASTRPARGAVEVDVTPQSDFLTDPGTEYPVVIDPQLALGVTFDTFVESDTTYDRSSDTDLRLGTWNGGGAVARSFISFQSTPLKGKQILSADLDIYMYHSYSCSAREWQVWSAAAASTATRWTSQPAWYQNYASSTLTTGYSSSCADGWVSVPITSLVQAFADNTNAINSLGLRAASETDSYGWKRFYASETGAGPSIWVTYNTPPNSPTGLTVSPAGSSIATDNPRLSATVSDPDPGGTLTGVFHLIQDGTPIREYRANGVPNGSVASWDVPDGLITEGHTYSFRVCTIDGLKQSQWVYSGTFVFDTTAPAAPTVSSTDYPDDGAWHGDTSVEGAFTLTPAVDASLDRFEWAWDAAPNPNNRLAANANGTASVLRLSPPGIGVHVLQVRAVDRAGNTSAVVKYAFNVGRAGIVTPSDNVRVVRRVRLDVTGESAFRVVKFEWRRGPDSTSSQVVPLGDLATSSGTSWQTAATNGWAPLPTAATAYTTWDLASTLGPAGGPAQVRAVVAADTGGADAYSTAWITLTLDPDADGAATTSVGPATVNLLTGDGSLTGTDAEEFGLSIVRTASSRDTDAGYQLQQEKLADGTREGTSTAGLSSGNVTVSVANDRYHTGTSSLKMLPQPANSDGNTYTVITDNTSAMPTRLEPGRRYRISAWAYVPAPTAGPPAGGISVAMTMRLLTRQAAAPDWVQAPGGQSAQPAVANVWQHLSMDVDIRPDAVQSYLILVNGFTGASAQAVYWDDISVRELWAPFGKEWSLGTVDSIAGTAYTTVTNPSEGVVGVGVVGGGSLWFTSGNGVKWWPQPGAEDLKLTRDTTADTWRLTELDGTTTDFAKDPATQDWPVVASTPPGAESKARHVYAIVGGQYRLSRIIAPVEDGVDGWPSNAQACNPAGAAAPARGCETLDLTYATTTTATSTTFGDVTGQVSAITAWSWDPTTAAMVHTPVAAYAYDDTGRLRQVWDPRLETAGSNRQATTYEYDTSGRVTTVTPPGEPAWTFTYGAGGASTTGTGDWIDPSPGRLLGVTRASLVEGSTDTLGPDNTTTVVYDVPLTRASGGPYDLGPDALATWVQTDGPTDATAVFGPQDSPAVTTATATTPGPDGYAPATVHYLNATGLEVNTAAPAGTDTPVEGFVDTAEHDRFGNVVRTLDATNRLLALGALPGATAMLTQWGLQNRSGTDLAQLLDARTTYSADGLDVVSELAPAQLLAVGSNPSDQRLLRPRTRYTYDQGKPDGAAYHLVTTAISDGYDPATGDSVEAVATATGYTPVDQAGAVRPALGLDPTSGWVHKQPTSVTVDAGQSTATTSWTIYDDHGRPLRSSKPGSSGTDAATTVSVLYTAGPDATHPECGNHPEWAGQGCLTTAAGSVSGYASGNAASALPVKHTTGYNKWGSPTVVTETATGPVGGTTSTVTRTTTTTYDAADRVTDVTVTGSGTGVGQAMDVTHTLYDPDTGDVTGIQQLGTGGAVVGQITKAYDVLGRLVSYTDATGATTTSTYDRYGNVVHTAQVIAGVTTTTDFAYDRTTEPRGYVTAITDSVAGTIAPTWGPDGQLTSEQLPGGITLTIGYDPAQVPVARSYTRDSDGEHLWDDSTVDNHRGQQVMHFATTGTSSYGYDRLGRLVGVYDTPAGTGAVCTGRYYAYDSHSNRTMRATATSATPEAGCPIVGADPSTTYRSYVYDSADRLVSTSEDGGAAWVYDPLGRTTSMPTAGETLVNDFYVNDLVAAQTITAQARYTWNLDPIQRRATNTQYEWVNNAWAESATKVSHYATDSDEPAWISEDVTNPADVTRFVSGAEGDIAVTTSTTGDRVVQLVDLHGDVVGTLPVADGATQATWTGLAYQRTDEFGAPQPLTGAGAPTGPPARYGWLGAAQRSSEALGGVVLMGARLYSTITGRFLSVDPVPGGSATAYDYCNADPINCTDLAGTFSLGGLLKAVAVVGEIASLVPGPVGAAAAGISAVAYAAQGDTSKALEMGVTAAANLVGCGAVVKVATRVGAAVKAGAMASRAAPKLERAAAMVKKVLPKVRKVATCALDNSFAPGTLVVLADGTLTPIDTLQTGDLVLATDSITGDTTAQPVLAPIVGTGTRHLIDITTRAGTWTATAGHPIWVVGTGWTHASNLTPGDELLSADETPVAVTAVADRGDVADQTVYNLSVANTHTYYVADANGDSALVHNCPAAVGRAHNDIQRAVVALAKDAKKAGRISIEDARVLDRWRVEAGLPGHGPMLHPNRPTSWSGVNVHISVGKVRHIKVGRMRAV